jgi:hypothetical protein
MIHKDKKGSSGAADDRGGVEVKTYHHHRVCF